MLGSSNTDMIVRVPRLPGPGETLLGGAFTTAAGGKGANQAVAAARAGARVCFIARLGSDALGDEALLGFQTEGIDTSAITRDPSLPSGVALIFVADSGENSIAVAGGANEALVPEVVRAAAVSLRNAHCVLLQLETPLASAIEAARLAKQAGALVVLNPAPAQVLPEALLKNVDWLTPNEHEAMLLSGIKVFDLESARCAARFLRAQGPRAVILTLGAAGAFVSSPDFEDLVPGFQMKAVDTTAAGDVFNGALAVRLAEGASLREAVRFAHAAAALSVTRLGAQPSIPFRSEIDSLLALP